MPKRTKISYAQKELPFNGATRAIREPFTLEWRVVGALVALLLVLVLLYGYALVSSIAHVSLRESALKESRALAAERASLESQYLAKTGGITEKYARTLGYTDVGERVFLDRAALSYAPNAR